MEGRKKNGLRTGGWESSKEEWPNKEAPMVSFPSCPDLRTFGKNTPYVSPWRTQPLKHAAIGGWHQSHPQKPKKRPLHPLKQQPPAQLAQEFKLEQAVHIPTQGRKEALHGFSLSRTVTGRE